MLGQVLANVGQRIVEWRTPVREVGSDFLDRIDQLCQAGIAERGFCDLPSTGAVEPTVGLTVIPAGDDVEAERSRAAARRVGPRKSIDRRS